MLPELVIDMANGLLDRPFLLGLLLALATFITEDGSLILGSQLLGTGLSSADIIVTSLILGIVIGDIGLYGLGRLARRQRVIRRYIPLRAVRGFKRWIQGRESGVLFLSRFMPGTRLPTYVSFGFLRLSLARFVIVMAVAAGVWVGGTLYLIQEAQRALMGVDTAWGLFGGILLAFLLIVIIPSRLKRSRALKAYSAEGLPPLEPGDQKSAS